MGVTLDTVTKTFGDVRAVDGVSVEIPGRSFFAILGPSGCGKSTLLRLIAGLEEPDSGRIALDGQTVADAGIQVPAERRGVGFVFQSYALWPHMTVAENVAFPIEAKGAGRKNALRQAEGPIRTVRLDGLKDRRPGALSGGQQQRVALARCLASNTGTILMDEPLANLDPHLRAEMEGELRQFHERSGATTLYITHDQREAMALADLVAVMSDGRFLQVADPETLYERPASVTVARFIGKGAILSATVEKVAGGTARVTAGGMALDAACLPGTKPGPAPVLLRDEDVCPADMAPGHPVMTGRVARALYRGGRWDCWVSVEGLSEPLIAALPGRPDIGADITLAIRSGWVIPDPS